MASAAKKKEKELQPVELGMVLYADGGCRPSRGIGGWGLHGYTYNLLDSKDGTAKKTNAPTNRGYYDGATIVKDDSIVSATPLNYIDAWGSLIPESTNNIAELTASINGLDLIRDQDAREACMLLDSQYVLKGLLEWSPRWSANNWRRPDGTEVPNKELWTTLINKHDTLLEDGYQIRWDWVKGHSANLGNDLADYNATRGVVLGKKNIDVSTLEINDAKGYWNPKVSYNRMFTHPRWYFSTNASSGTTADGRHIYYCGDHGAAKDNDLLGKRATEHTFSVLFLKEQEPVMEVVRAYQNQVCTSSYEIVVGYLNKILSTTTYAEIAKYGDQFLTQPTHLPDLYCIDEQPVTWVARPPRLAFNAVEYLNILQSLLEGFVQPDDAPWKICRTDLTPYFYEQETVKGKVVTKLSSKVTNALKALEVVAQYDTTGELKTMPLKLTISIDLPNRNALSALAPRDPTVTLITYRESDEGFRYAVVISAGEDIGIWSSIHSNLKILLEP